MTWLQIKLLEKIGLAWDLRVPSKSQIARREIPFEATA